MSWWFCSSEVGISVKSQSSSHLSAISGKEIESSEDYLSFNQCPSYCGRAFRIRNLLVRQESKKQILGLVPEREQGGVSTENLVKDEEDVKNGTMSSEESEVHERFVFSRT